ncbi:APC family permease [Schaalia sp. lx-100]|uniref:APC family permease n=1 Tax=Schaalia sp. lx-100 TaxID=2899081 RepID=UPI001E4A7061|nr:APC family permease [Schaalia sp. lx-100]
MLHFVANMKRAVALWPFTSHRHFTEEESKRHIPFQRVAAAACGAGILSSLAYAPDQILMTLTGGGVFSLSHSVGVAVCVALVFTLVVMSYRHSMYAYPRGGEYEVTYTNIGPSWGILVAAAVIIDCVLTVSVSVASAAQYFVSLFPFLAGKHVYVACAMLCVLAAIHARQRHRMRALWAIPTYFFVTIIVILLITGCIQLLTASGEGVFVAVPPQIHEAPVSVGLAGYILLLRAFSLGCTVMTGAETFSYDVYRFPRPQSVRAARSLSKIAACAGLLLIALVCVSQYGDRLISPLTVESSETYPLSEAVSQKARIPVIMQVAHRVFGPQTLGTFIVAIATISILFLAARMVFHTVTSQVSVLALQGCMPIYWHHRYSRFSGAYAWMLLICVAGVVVVMTQANLATLIHLYAVAAFIILTVSQLAMIRYWNTQLRERQTGGARKQTLRSRSLNIVGFILTSIVFVVILATEFIQGAWVTLAMVVFLYAIYAAYRHYHTKLEYEVNVNQWDEACRVPNRVRAVVLISKWDKPHMRALAVARASGAVTVEAVALAVSATAEDLVREQWRELGLPVPLTILYTSKRDMVALLSDHIRLVREQYPHEVLSVYFPQVIGKYWWESILHRRITRALRLAVMDIPDTVLTLVPWKRAN